jgi:hypothetical protein
MSNRRKTSKRPSAPHASMKPGLYVLNIQHDDGCPTIRTQRESECTCSEVLERLVDGETYFKQLKKAGAR